MLYRLALAAACLCCASACKDLKPALERSDNENYRLRKELATASEQLQKATTELGLEKANRTRSDENLKVIRAKLEETRKELETTRNALDNYRRDFQLQSRVRAVGQKLPELATSDGKSYRDVTVRAVLTDSVLILHAEGTAKILLASLGEKWTRRFDAGGTPVCVLDEATLKDACDRAFKAR